MTKRSVLPAIGCNNSSARLPVRCSKVAALPRVLINTHAEEIEIKIEKENKEKQSACVCLDDTQPSDEGGARADAGGVAAIDDNADWKDGNPF